jgi:glycosyltransferase involved in cell wall biosynthesis
VDVFALSSIREALPNVILEAMAMKAPVLATRVAGVPEVVRDGVNGLLVEPGKVDELSRSLARLLKDGELRMRLREAGRLTIERAHSFQARMEKVRAIYDGLLGKQLAVCQ